MRTISGVLVALGCALLIGCSGATPASGAPASQGASGQPTVSVSAPSPGSTVTLGTPVAVLVKAADSIGVARVDLTVDDVAVDSYTTPNSAGQPSVSAQLQWTPSAIGAHALSVTAYRADGTASVPAVIAVTVSGPGAGASPVGSLPSGSASSPAPTETTTAATPALTPAPTPAPTARPTRRPPPPTPKPTPRPLVIDLRTDLAEVSTQSNGTGTTFVVVSVFVKNLGSDPSGPFVVQVTCQGATKSTRATSVPPGTYSGVDVDFSPTDVGTDAHARAVLDPGNHVRETNESNNAVDITDSMCAIPPH